jgi:rhamnogalacturonan endolyase
MKLKTKISALALGALLSATSLRAQSQMENLDRGVVAVRTSSSQVYVGWRQLGTEAYTVGYNVYRGGTKLNASPITTSTNYVDSTTANSTYTVRAVVGGVEQSDSPSVSVWAQNYLSIPLSIPAGGTGPDGVAYTYNACDCSVGDVDGDGQYEIILKWDPSNSKDNSQSGNTGDVYLDAYKLNGARLWRIDLGKNIRAGAHYTQFQVYDYDGDGKAEIMCKTAPGTKDGTGAYLSKGAAAGADNAADYRNSSGYILSGPEWLTVFAGPSGKELATVNYNPARGTVGDWGDTYGNRVDRFLAGTAYLDGKHPSAIFCRGYYTRCVLAAWDWNGTTLTNRWTFDSNNSGYSGYMGQGCHSLTIGDVDGDGFDEIVYGACCIDHNGAGKYTTGLGHGDALHMSKMDPARSGLQVWQAHEDEATNGNIGASYRDANTGAIIFSSSATGDTGRACASNVSTSVKGYQMWSGANSTLYNVSGGSVGSAPSSDNFVIWWEAGLTRDLLNGTTINNYAGTTLLSPSGLSSNNSTKSNPCLSADILGDWREEVIWRASDNSELRIYTTTAVTTNRIFTLMHDRQYREAIAWQNTAYNQPPHPSFYLGYGMTLPVPLPNITLVGGSTPPPTGDTYQAENAVLAGGTVVESTNAGYHGTGYANSSSSGGTITFNGVDGNGGGAKSLTIRFANGGTAARTGNLIVNGTTTPITFATTGAWTTWVTMNVNITLNNNTSNTIQFATTGNDLGNIDEITVP